MGALLRTVTVGEFGNENERNTDLTWYALRTDPQREKLVRTLFKRKGHIVYLPAKVIKGHRRRGGAKRRIVPLMPGYVMVQADNYPLQLGRDATRQDRDRMARWYAEQRSMVMISVLAVRHVRGVFGPIDDAKVETLRRVIKDEVALDAVRRTPKRLKIGGDARIKVGPYAGTTAKVSFMRGGNAKLLIWLMGSEREVTARIENVEAA